MDNIIPELRPYQLDLLDEIRNQIKKGKKSICCVIGCGAGKSFILSELIRLTTNKKNRVLFLVHRKELLNQIVNTLELFNVDMEYCDCVTIQSAVRKLNKITPPSIIIVDEFHHALSNSYIKVFEEFSSSLKIGFTATPTRLGTGGLEKVSDSLIIGKSTKWLIKNNFLSPFKIYGIETIDTSNVPIIRGDFDKVKLAEVLDNKYIYGDIFDNWNRLANGLQTIIYSTSIKSSKMIVEKFKSKNIACEHIGSTTNATERKQILEDFKNKKIMVLSNVDLFGEGISIDECSCVCLARPTQSLSLYIQQSLRPCRYQEGKTALILDFSGNVARHGFPDEKREWTLEETSKKHNKSDTETRILQCPQCFFVSRVESEYCGTCGYSFHEEITKIKKQKKEKQKKEYELKELEELAKMHINDMDFKTWEEVEKFRKSHKYKPFWSVRKSIELGIEVPTKKLYAFKKFSNGSRHA